MLAQAGGRSPGPHALPLAYQRFIEAIAAELLQLLLQEALACEKGTACGDPAPPFLRFNQRLLILFNLLLQLNLVLHL